MHIFFFIYMLAYKYSEVCYNFFLIYLFQCLLIRVSKVKHCHQASLIMLLVTIKMSTQTSIKTNENKENIIWKIEHSFRLAPYQTIICYTRRTYMRCARI